MVEDLKDDEKDEEEEKEEVEEDTAKILGPTLRERHKHSSREEVALESLAMMSPKFGGQESNSSLSMSAAMVKEKEASTLGSLLSASSGSGVLRQQPQGPGSAKRPQMTSSQ